MMNLWGRIKKKREKKRTNLQHKRILWGELTQFSLVAQLCPTLCDPMDCSKPGLPFITNSINPSRQLKKTKNSTGSRWIRRLEPTNTWKALTQKSVYKNPQGFPLSFLWHSHKIDISDRYCPRIWCAAQGIFLYLYNHLCGIRTQKRIAVLHVYVTTESSICALKTSSNSKSTLLKHSTGMRFKKTKRNNSNIYFIPSSLPGLGCYPFPGTWAGLVPMTGMGHGIREGALNLEPKYTCTVWLAQSGPHALVHPKDGGTPSAFKDLGKLT